MWCWIGGGGYLSVAVCYHPVRGHVDGYERECVGMCRCCLSSNVAFGFWLSVFDVRYRVRVGVLFTSCFRSIEQSILWSEKFVIDGK
jgi:hypothetical protein